MKSLFWTPLTKTAYLLLVEVIFSAYSGWFIWGMLVDPSAGSAYVEIYSTLGWLYGLVLGIFMMLPTAILFYAQYVELERKREILENADSVLPNPGGGDVRAD